jgi:hypothetical protein
LKNLKAVVIGYEGFIKTNDATNNREIYMQWDSDGTALCSDRGCDLLVRVDKI